MTRKLISPAIAALTALILVFGTTGFTYAAPASPEPDAGNVRAAGRVVSLAAPDFVLRTLRGDVTVHTTGATTWRNLSGFDALQPGMFVGVAGVQEGNGTINARIVERRPLARIAGVVQGVGDHTLTVHTLSGATVTVAWGEQTRCVIRGTGDAAGEDSACSRIQVHDRIVAEGLREGNTLHAWHIAVRVPGDGPAA